jgi:hypothetical protein
VKTRASAKGPPARRTTAPRQTAGASSPNAGVVDWLLAYPEKGSFTAIESESTESL